MDVEKLLRELAVLQEGHFVLNSGLHSKYYFQKFRILENPDATTQLCTRIVDEYRNKGVEWVVGPTTGGIVIAFEVARQLGVRTGFAEERDGKRTVGRGFGIKGKRVLVVDDVMTTGKSIIETIDAVKDGGGEVAGVAVLIDRCSVRLPFEYYSTYKKAVENFEPAKCPLCQENVSLSRPGGT